MKIFRALSKLYNYLTKEKSSVNCEEPQVRKEPETQIIEEEEILESTIENSYVSDVRDWAVKRLNFFMKQIVTEMQKHFLLSFPNGLIFQKVLKNWIIFV